MRLLNECFDEDIRGQSGKPLRPGAFTIYWLLYFLYRYFLSFNSANTCILPSPTRFICFPNIFHIQYLLQYSAYLFLTITILQYLTIRILTILSVACSSLITQFTSFQIIFIFPWKSFSNCSPHRQARFFSQH